MTFASRFGMALALSFFVSMAGGCYCKTPHTQAFEVTVEMDQSALAKLMKADPSADAVPVDIVGVGKASSNLQGKSTRQYFYGENVGGNLTPALRSDDRFTMLFKPGGPQEMKLTLGDPIWAKWLEKRAIDGIAVFADFRSFNSNEKPLYVSLLCSDWDEKGFNAQKIRIRVTEQYSELQTVQRPPK